jgi:hypothetical protein
VNKAIFGKRVRVYTTIVHRRGMNSHMFAGDGGTSYLGHHRTVPRSCLVCTFGTPVADMLAHLPLLPYIIDYTRGDAKTTGDRVSNAM